MIPLTRSKNHTEIENMPDSLIFKGIFRTAGLSWVIVANAVKKIDTVIPGAPGMVRLYQM